MILKKINGLSISTKSLENVDDSVAVNGDILKYNSTSKKWESKPSTPIFIQASASENGTISPNGIFNCQSGDNVAYTITPNTKYRIKNIFIDGLKTDVVDDTYVFSNIQYSHMIHVDFEEKSFSQTIFTIHKDIAATSPEICVTYEGSSVTSPAHAYQLIYDLICPSVVKDGQVNYFLCKNDLTKKATDETGLIPSGEESKLDGIDGDVCISIKPIWWKVIDNTANELVFKLSSTPFEGAITAHNYNGTVRKWLHIGMFESTTQACTSIYSTSIKPKASVTNDNFRSSTESRGETYNIMTHLTWELLNILYVFTSGSLNLKVTVGKDYVNGSNSTTVSTEEMLTANGYTSATKSDDTKSLMYLFIANPWGNLHEWICGLKGVSGYVGIITDQKQARGVSINDEIPMAWEKFGNPTNISSYIKDVCGKTEYPFLIKSEGNANENTYFCAWSFLWSSDKYCSAIGGYWHTVDEPSPFTSNLNYMSTTANDSTTARLQILDVNGI